MAAYGGNETGSEGASVGAIAPEFLGAMKRLMGLKFAPASLDTHWEALHDLTPLELSEAIEQAQRECDEFPSPKMLRMFVDQFRSRIEIPEEDWSRATPIEPREIRFPDGRVIRITHEWKYYCEDCNDTGQRVNWCGVRPSTRRPWLPVMQCGRRAEHGEHEWDDRCPCADTNPDVLRKKARAQQVTRTTTNG
jgi:hypothetical protein